MERTRCTLLPIPPSLTIPIAAVQIKRTHDATASRGANERMEQPHILRYCIPWWTSSLCVDLKKVILVPKNNNAFMVIHVSTNQTNQL